ncbi:16S/23S rRNA (cytidine-2'-O)-methyltransferase TlyA [Oxobacter pfennigii]|uniref:16S/23S rRNA (Cytidine-2'-O)-methyltransferase TlyA n=1 Tax=Oxobacter pfennigii TaxID=36849 RepID=A0A0P8X266_9CLOT|nr:TlyA family RNA methyltransferase [Oxobacter pfennigii]KPU44905.1 16S/23S rRNA (cytidine-2'-O)-methyltransferase TlyA [Oxobacter pfennigii]
MAKERLDTLLVNRGFFPTREKARKSIMAGLIFIENKRYDKPGDIVNADSNIEVKGTLIPYVSRGGLKLEKALQEFNISVLNKKAIDVGASTGGFTDCLLKNGAKSVVSIDVGYGQFAWELRNDKRVTLMERTNIRYVKEEDIGYLCDICTIDVSFISLRLVLPVVKKLLNSEGEVICLIKPQFEAGRDKVGKKGVVKDPKTHREVISSVLKFASDSGFSVIALSFSPIKGPEGNIEYLAHLKNTPFIDTGFDTDSKVISVVEKSHSEFV